MYIYLQRRKCFSGGMVKRVTLLRQKAEQRASALERIRALFDAAAVVFAEDAEKAHKLVAQAYQLVLRAKVKLPAVLKRRFCKQCRSFWIPGRTVRIRVGQGNVAYTCLTCKHITRLPLE